MVIRIINILAELSIVRNGAVVHSPCMELLEKVDISTESVRSASPKQRGQFLRAAADFQTELFRVMAGFLPGMANWELRREVSRLVFRDARRVQDLRHRCKELGGGASGTHLSRGVAGNELIEALCGTADSATAYRLIFGVVKPALKQAMGDYLRDDLQVFDAPSIPVVEENINELEKQLSWAAQQESLSADDVDDSLRAEVEEMSAKLFDQLSLGSSLKVEPVRAGRKMGTLPILRSQHPEGFREGLASLPSADASQYAERELFHAHNFLMEVQAADSCASLLFEVPDMPWEFYFDTSRHMWDESRHCEFGEIKLRALGRDMREMGLSNTAYVMRQTLDPLDRYAALTTQEADAFPGKHAGLKDALANNDDLSARAWSYDISDETQHVRYGHKWIPVMIEATGDPRSYEELKRDAENWRRDVLAATYSTASQILAAQKK